MKGAVPETIGFEVFRHSSISRINGQPNPETTVITAGEGPARQFLHDITITHGVGQVRTQEWKSFSTDE